MNCSDLGGRMKRFGVLLAVGCLAFSFSNLKAEEDCPSWSDKNAVQAWVSQASDRLLELANTYCPENGFGTNFSCDEVSAAQYHVSAIFDIAAPVTECCVAKAESMTPAQSYLLRNRLNQRKKHIEEYHRDICESRDRVDHSFPKDIWMCIEELVPDACGDVELVAADLEEQVGHVIQGHLNHRVDFEATFTETAGKM